MSKRPQWQSWFGNLLGAFTFGALIGFSLCWAIFVSQEDSEPVPPLAANAEPQNQLPVESAPPPPIVEPEPTAPTREPLDEELWVARHLFITVEGQWLTPAAREALRDIRPGGVVLRPTNLNSATQTRSLVREIKEAAGMGGGFTDLPIVTVAPYGTGGAGTRLTDGPTPAEIARLDGDAEFEAEALGHALAEAAADRGITMIVGPLFDVYETNSAFPRLEALSFGADRTVVKRLALAMATGVMDGGVIPAAAYFPGYGAAQRRATDGRLVLQKDIPGLAELTYPLKEAVAAGVPAVMAGHVAVPALDPDDPERLASRSPKLLQDILRGRLGFRGVIIGDDAMAAAATLDGTPAEGVIASLAAGCDAIFLYESDPDQIVELCRMIEEAVRDGRIDETALEESRGRLDDLQGWLEAPERVEKSLPRFEVSLNEDTPAAPLLDDPEPMLDANPVTNAQPIALDDISLDEAPPADEASDDTEEAPSEGDATDTAALEGDETESADEPEVAEETPSEDDTPPADDAMDEEPLTPEPEEATDAPSEEPEPDAPTEDETKALDETTPEDAASPTEETDTPEPESEEDADDPATVDEETATVDEAGTVDETLPEATSNAEYEEAPATSDEEAAGGDTAEDEPETEEAEPEMTAPAAEENAEADSAEPGPNDESTAPEPAEEDAPAEEGATTEDDAPAPDDEATDEDKAASTDEPEAPSPEDTVAEEAPETDAVPETRLVHRVGPTETLAQVARLYEVTPSEIVAWNELSGVDVNYGMELAIFVPESDAERIQASLPPSDVTLKEVEHVIQRGETLTSIARLYDVDVAELVAWNRLSNPYVKAGDALTIFKGPEDEVEKITEEAERELEENLTTYRVQRGDTLLKISRKLGVTTQALMDVNGINDPNHVVVGQNLKVPYTP